MISSQTGDTAKTVEQRYARYAPDVDNSADIVESEIAKVKTHEKFSLFEIDREGNDLEKRAVYQGIRDGAGGGGRTHDLMLGKKKAA